MDVFDHVFKDKGEPILNLIQFLAADLLSDDRNDPAFDLADVLLLLSPLELVLNVLEDILQIFPKIILEQSVNFPQNMKLKLFLLLSPAIFDIEIDAAQRNGWTRCILQ